MIHDNNRNRQVSATYATALVMMARDKDVPTSLHGLLTAIVLELDLADKTLPDPEFMMDELKRSWKRAHAPGSPEGP